MMPPFMAASAVEIRRQPSMAFFAILAIVVVIGSYLFIALLAVSCVYLPYLVLAKSESAPGQVVLLFLFGIVIAGAMLWSLIPRRDKFEAPGMLIERAAYPRLFSEIDSIAAALNEPVPREVYLIGDVNAFVADRAECSDSAAAASWDLACRCSQR
jgi:heat shock protein HtpX